MKEREREMIRTAVDQFVDDYLLVLENDRDGWHDLLEVAKEFNGDVSALADRLRSDWDDYVDQVAELAVKSWGTDAPATLLIRQMLGGWGDLPHRRIAAHLIDRINEEKPYRVEAVIG